MATKRHAPQTTDIKPKRAKFTLTEAHIPSTHKEGSLFVTGAGDFGQLGLGSDILEKTRFALVSIKEEIVDVCAGGMHTVCLTKEGKVLTFGCNDEGALGRNTSDKEDSEFVPDLVELPGKVIQISAGDSHTAALLEDGKVYAWGTFRDSHGNMGLTPKGNEKFPYLILADHTVVKIASGADHLVFLTNFGDIFTCGCAEQGQLGRTTERGSSRHARSGAGKDQLAKLLLPNLISTTPRLKLKFDDIWAGTYATFAKVAMKNDLYVFGLNNYNQLGLKSLAPQYKPKLSQQFSKHTWMSISCAQHHTLALDNDGKIYVIGRKEYGRLGLGKDCEDATELTEISNMSTKKIISISCGSATSFAVTEEGVLYGWGMGTVGQLGTGEDEDCYDPTIIKSKQLADKKIFRVSSGGQHTVVLALTNNNNNKIIDN
ncbi:regulator of chromosome condensation (rcc1) repeat [Holotrichia oblita]|uniref:Regulator of chromosome condensation (Rcc1) repeat n=1 Tax=Holotrichia oblita TaxID=644536 RepID=A0ACB9TUY9_HOLOL|nr:regulator of chromosome condensation (rcc1) repeat [Holotrichia oblita]